MFALLSLAVVGFSGGHNTAKGAEASKKLPALSNDGLRGVYYGTAKQGAAEDKVGRLAIELLEGSLSTTVRVDHPFRTGDKFRFKVSSNQDGWLYILHRSATEKLGLIWPRMAADNKEEYLDMNRIRANQTYTVPPSPGLFIFDDEVGTEYFSVVVAAERKIPQLAAQDASRSEAIASTETNGRTKRIINFGVRSTKMPKTQSLRGVLYDPGKQDTDPFLYFATPADDDSAPIFVEFQLKHQE